jgi:predicted RNA-binding protein
VGKTYWMLVTTGENFEITRERGFDLQGIDSSQRKKALRINADDRMVFYLSDRRVFAATATVASSHFEDHSPIWRHPKEAEDFPYRVKIRADAVLPAERHLDAYQIGPRLEYVRKWPPEEWELAFIGGLHIIPQKDFAYLEDEMRRILSSQDAVRGLRRRRNRRGRRRPYEAGRDDGSRGDVGRDERGRGDDMEVGEGTGDGRAHDDDPEEDREGVESPGDEGGREDEGRDGTEAAGEPGRPG